MPYREIPAFLLQLRRRRGMAPLALEFTVLAAGRQYETREAPWSEFDLRAGLWTIPVERLKTRKTRKEPHCVVLTPPMLVILDRLLPLKTDETSFVFPSPMGGPLGATAMRQLLYQFGYESSPHGFRRSFKTWASEQTMFNRLEVELALAHVIRGVEGVYLDSQLLERRALLGQAWADFCLGLTPPKAANVVPLWRSNATNKDHPLLEARRRQEAD